MNGNRRASGATPDAAVRPWAALLVPIAVGALAGALYGGLVGAVHFLTHGRWDSVPSFMAGCTTTGAAIGLGIGAGLALATLVSNLCRRVFRGSLLACGLLFGLASLFCSRLLAADNWALLLALAGLTCLMAYFSLVAGSMQPTTPEGDRDAQRVCRSPARI